MNPSLSFKLKNESMTLKALIEGFNGNILDIKYTTEENLIKIDSYNVKDEEAFKEVGFYFFVKWVFSKYKNLKKIDSYAFIGLDNKTLFLFKTESLKSLFPFTTIFVSDFLENIKSGRGKHDICPIPNLLRYNIGIIGGFNDLKDFPMHPSDDDCELHKEHIIQWFNGKIDDDEKFGKMLGGQGYLIDLDPNLVELTSTREEEEKLFNSFLTLYARSLYEFEYMSSNCIVSRPFETNEIDGFLWDKQNDMLLVLETTLEKKINGDHLKSKIYTATVLNTANIGDYNYLYITAGKEDDISSLHGHGTLFNAIDSQYDVPFKLISAPPGFNLTYFNLRDLYNHFLDEMEYIVKK